MANTQGLIFDIQGFSVHDGPGSRTTVFLSGCPLRCTWCANPEGRELKQQLMHSKQKCKLGAGCGRCIRACTHGAMIEKNGELQRNVLLCQNCKEQQCSYACYREALRLSGKWYSVPQLMEVLNRDRQFWSGGGVTFSGGEPLMQKDFLLEVLTACKDAGIHTAIETTAFAEAGDFLHIMSLVDFAFIDVKHMDSALHLSKTGVDNHIILENIRKLKTEGWNGRLILRMPVISGYNDTVDNTDATIAYMQSNDLQEINILPFHRMGDSKWTQLGLTYEHREELPTAREKLEEIQKLFRDGNRTCYIGDELVY